MPDIITVGHSNCTTAGNYTWTAWSQDWVSTTITCNQIVWTVWTGSTSASITQQANVWPMWTQSYQVTGGVMIAQNMPGARVPTQEELRKAKEQRERDQARWAEDDRKRKVEADGAKRRAEDLLRRHLTEEQRRDLDAKNCFYLESLGKDGERRKYRIDRGTHGNVKLLDKTGKIIGQYCVQPSGVPAEDAMLAQKLWLETDEEAFKKVANFSRHY